MEHKGKNPKHNSEVVVTGYHHNNGAFGYTENISEEEYSKKYKSVIDKFTELLSLAINNGKAKAGRLEITIDPVETE